MRRLLPALLVFCFSASALAEETTCTVPVGPGPGSATVELILEGPTWEGWAKFCRLLVPYLDTGPGPFDETVADRVRERLLTTSYFEIADCVVSEGNANHLSCSLLPTAIVHRIKITGKVPFAILKRSLQRRIFLRPGLILQFDPGIMDRQQARLSGYIEGEGYFGGGVDLELEPDPGGWPNRGVLVRANVTPGKTAQIRGVSVAGKHPIPAHWIDGRVRHYAFLWAYQDRFRPKLFQQDLEELEDELRAEGWPSARSEGRYEMAEDGETVNVYVTMESGPWLDLQFAGNKKIKTKKLRKLETFSAARSIDSLSIADTRGEVLKAYQKKGYFDTTVDTRTRTFDDRIQVRYTITEGKKLSVTSVNVTGNVTFPSETIIEKSGLATRPRTALAGGGYWVDAYVARDARAIAAFYRSRGFDLVQVSVDRVQNQNGIEVTFKVDEGTTRTVSAVRVVGLPPAIRPGRVFASLRTKEQGRLVNARLARDEQYLVSALLRKGFLDADVESTVQGISGSSPTVEVTFRVRPGLQYRYGGLFVRGNFRTKKLVVEKQLGLKTGQPLDLVALGQAKKKLRGLGVFSAVDLKPLTTGARDDEIWLLAAVEERDKRTGDLIFTADTDTAFSLGGTYRDGNLFGRAVQIEMTARVGEAFRYILPQNFKIGDVNELEGSLRAPRPFGLFFDLAANAKYRKEISDAVNEEIATIGSSGSRELLNRRQCKSCPDIIATARFDVSSQRKDTDEVDEEQITIAKFSFNPVLQRRDSLVDPRRGILISGQAAFAHDELGPGVGPNGAATFWKLALRTSAFVTLFDPPTNPSGGASVGPLIWATSVDVGVARPFGHSFELPLSEGFVYGGDYSLRGAVKNVSERYLPRAHYLFLARSELRWYVVRDYGFWPIQIAGFADLGSVSLKDHEVLDDPALSIGPALRIITPVGPLSVEWGWVIRRPQAVLDLHELDIVNKDSIMPPAGRLHVTFGYAF